MKKRYYKMLAVILVTVALFLTGSCVKDLLNQQPTTELGSAAFWKTDADATTALMGLYSAVRPVFDRDYYFDGQTEYVRTRGTSTTNGNLVKGDAYNGGGYNPSGYGANFDKYYRYLYGAVNRANYLIDNVRGMLSTAKPSSLANLESIISEARFLRGIVYFRLISMWGDVPYLSRTIIDPSEVTSLSRIPIAQIKDSILADFADAIDKLPSTLTQGRASKPAALAFRGKFELYWACWNKFGWPELDTFTPDATAATEAYTAAAADFDQVINDFGLNLFMNGEPGGIDSLGKADILPNYFYLFIPLPSNNLTADGEMIMTFNHGGTGTGQGEELMRDVAGRSHEGSQCWVSPRYEIADRYQLTTTGDFATPLIPMNPTTNLTARTTPNSAVNPGSYRNRDYRMKASIMWDYEISVGLNSLKSTGWCPFIYKSWAVPVTIDGVTYLTYNTDGDNSGYVFRKFLRNYPGQGRSDGDYSWPVMRLADVYLMYAEATNELNGPQADAIALVNKIRHRGNLPPMPGYMTADKNSFFSAIEQERIIELLGEGQRSFDLRRWRAIERVWGPVNSAGVWRIDTWGANQQRYFQNLTELQYQQCYIFRIPPSERDRDPNLTQNKPWL